MVGGLGVYDVLQAAQMCHPELPPDQAVLQFHRDLYASLPEAVRSGLPENVLQAAQMCHPELPPDQAVLQFHRDLYDSLPEAVRSGLPEIAKAIAEVFGSPPIVFASRLVTILRGLRKTSNTTNERFDSSSLAKQINISIINGSLNSDLRFRNSFILSALFGAALAVKVGRDAIKRIGSAIEGIKEELSIQSIAKVQGWGEGGLGHHIHRLVSMEIEMSRHRRGLHLFYVWTPGNTSWQARFEERCRELPLGHQFGGYHHDLGTVCTQMWLNRRTLVEMLPSGRDATFYLLVPSFETIAIDEPIIFHESLRPLVVKGDLYRDQPLVWLNPASHRDAAVLRNVGILPDINERVFEMGGKSFLGFWASGAACATTMVVGATICPPLLLYEPYFAGAFVSSCMGGMTSAIGTMGALAYNDFTRPGPRVLGPPDIENLDTQ